MISLDHVAEANPDISRLGTDISHPNNLEANRTNSAVPAESVSHAITSENEKETDQIMTNASFTAGATSSSPTRGVASSREPLFKFGPYVPILRKDDGVIIDPHGIVDYFCETETTELGKRLTCEVLPDDAIVEAPSLVVPLLLKKKTIWPPRELADCNGEGDCQESSAVNDAEQNSDDIQVVKVVKKAPSQPDDACNKRPIDDYVKSAAVASLTNSKSNTNGSLLSIEDYYKSSAGQLLLGIGLSRVREIALEDNTRRLASKIRRSNDDCASLIPELESARVQLAQARASNKPYLLERKYKCPHCSFRSECSLVLDGHLEVPHTNKRREFLCNWCEYKNKDSSQIVFHNLIEHKKRCRIDKPPSLHNCRYCTFECGSKRKITSHLTRCQQQFPHATALGPQDYGEQEYPAITSKLITQNDIKLYEQTLRAIRLSAYNPHQLKVSSSANQQGQAPQPILVVPRIMRPGVSTSTTTTMIGPTAPGVNMNQVRVPLTSSPWVATIGTIRDTNNRTIILNSNKNQSNTTQLLQLLSSQSNNLDQPDIRSLQHPKPQQAFVNGKSVLNSASDIVMGPHKQHIIPTGSQASTDQASVTAREQRGNPASPTESATSESSTSKPKGYTFVICEICDGYIKDLGQLKSHMQWSHKVKIQKKSLEARPPLQCQKCQWRFFTDQGLERHLLGAHSLVTSNMQEQVDRGVDSGRCTVCGRAYANKLVAHMREVHKSNLKPAHLSYKCTVCSATFNLYRLFENHVYSVHMSQ